MSKKQLSIVSLVACVGAVSGQCTAKPVDMPTCNQNEEEWCWATGAAEVIGFFHPTINGQPFPHDCSGVECQIVSVENGYPAGYCCKNPQACAHMSGKQDGPGIRHAIENFAGSGSGPDYTDVDRPLTEQETYAVLAQGHPVVIGVRWSQGGGHILTLGGCQDGKIRLHDPEPGNQQWQLLTYDEVMSYTLPAGQGHPAISGQWAFTVYKQGDLTGMDTTNPSSANESSTQTIIV